MCVCVLILRHLPDTQRDSMFVCMCMRRERYRGHVRAHDCSAISDKTILENLPHTLNLETNVACIAPSPVNPKPKPHITQSPSESGGREGDVLTNVCVRESITTIITQSPR